VTMEMLRFINPGDFSIGAHLPRRDRLAGAADAG